MDTRPEGIRPERARVYHYGQQFGNNSVWVDEIIEPNRPDPDPFTWIDDFLGELERSQLYLTLLVSDWPGSGIPIAGQRAAATFFEVELFYAAMLGRPIAVVWRPDINLSPSTTALLRLLRRALPDIAWKTVSSSKEAETVAVDLVNRAAEGRLRNLYQNTRRRGRILEQWWKWREPHPDAPGLRWLDGRLIPNDATPDERVVKECLIQASKVSSEGRRLSRLWVAARELMAVPYDRGTDPHWLAYWNQVLTAWHPSAAWYGLHGHPELGYMASLYSLADVRTKGRQMIPDWVDDPEWRAPDSALGSAYYAAAHRVSSRKLRKIGLEKALAFVGKARTEDPISHSNVLAIRGSILLKLRAHSAAVATYREVLQIRQAIGASPAAVGEAMTELGFGLLYRLKWRQGRDLIQQGIVMMDHDSVRPGFVVRALRKLAIASCLTGDIKNANRHRRAAAHLAENTDTGRADI